MPSVGVSKRLTEGKELFSDVFIFSELIVDDLQVDRTLSPSVFNLTWCSRVAWLSDCMRCADWMTAMGASTPAPNVSFWGGLIAEDRHRRRMADVDVVTATSSTSCCSCSAASSETSDACCSLSTLFSFCRRKHRAGMSRVSDGNVRCLGGAEVSASDFRSSGRGFDSWPGRNLVA